MDNKVSVKDVVEAIGQLDPKQRLELLSVLPAVLRLAPEDYGWLKAAESSFSFWNNEEDAIYDTL